MTVRFAGRGPWGRRGAARRGARRGITHAVAVLAFATLLATAGCGGGVDARDRVEAYLHDAGAVQARWMGSFKAANKTYADFASGKLEGDAAARRTARVRDDVRAARTALLALRPPAEARTLHERMLHVLDLDLALATETAQMASYVPAETAALAHLPAANRRLRHRLAAAAGHPAAQARALAAFKTALERTVRELRTLTPPPVLRVSHGDRIHALQRTAKLSGRLRTALREGDADRTGHLLDRLDSAPPDRRGLASQSVANYNRRTREVSSALQDVRRAEQALTRRFASS